MKLITCLCKGMTIFPSYIMMSRFPCWMASFILWVTIMVVSLLSATMLLSGGQRQALTLLMASLKKPKLLLLDEHTAALDPKTAGPDRAGRPHLPPSARPRAPCPCKDR